MTSKRVRGFAEWNPKADTQELMAQVQGILREYQDQLPLTARQVFYRLVGRYSYDKTEQAYSRLCEHLNRARREPRRDVPWHIPFDAIRDDGVSEARYSCWVDESSFWRSVRHSGENFKLDLQQYQPRHIEVLCEAAGMVPQLGAIARRYGISVSSSSGFDSTTRKYEFAEYLADLGKPVILLHIGDLDPSGVHIASSLDEDLQAFLEHLGSWDCELVRLAVTAEQAEQYELPTAPPKATDNRRFEHGYTVQAEALDPATLAQILDQAIQARIDQGALDHALREQESIRSSIREKLTDLAA